MTGLSAVIVAADAAVPVSSSPEAVVRTLSALVPAVIEGLIRNVVIAAPAGNEELRSIADHAGCELAEAYVAEGIIAAGLARARADRLLVFRAGHAPERALFEELFDLDGDLGRLRALRIRAAPGSFLTRLLPSLSRAVGLVAMRSALPSSAPDLPTLIRAARPGGTLRARLRRVA